MTFEPFSSTACKTIWVEQNVISMEWGTKKRQKSCIINSKGDTSYSVFKNEQGFRVEFLVRSGVQWEFHVSSYFYSTLPTQVHLAFVGDKFYSSFASNFYFLVSIYDSYILAYRNGSLFYSTLLYTCKFIILYREKEELGRYIHSLSYTRHLTWWGLGLAPSWELGIENWEP